MREGQQAISIVMVACVDEQAIDVVMVARVRLRKRIAVIVVMPGVG